MTTRTATKTPDNQPFDYNLDAVEAESDLSPWRVHWQGKKWEFAHLDNFDMWPFLSDESTGNDVEEALKIFQVALGEKQWAEFQKLPIPRYKLKALFEAYQKHCGAGMGEDGASSGS